jgi:hypothetical protein
LRPHRGDLVVAGVALEDLDVGKEAGARQEALEEIVREKGVVRNAPASARSNASTS